MKRKILLVAVLASSLTAVAQSFNSKTTLWLQSNKAVQNTSALNKVAPRKFIGEDGIEYSTSLYLE